MLGKQLLGKQLCNMPHLLQTIKLRIQTALIWLMMWRPMMFLPDAADPFWHNKLLAQPHQLGQIAASVPNSKAYSSNIGTLPGSAK